MLPKGLAAQWLNPKYEFRYLYCRERGCRQGVNQVRGILCHRGARDSGGLNRWQISSPADSEQYQCGEAGERKSG
jgi:hypothetical protein